MNISQPRYFAVYLPVSISSNGYTLDFGNAETLRSSSNLGSYAVIGNRSASNGYEQVGTKPGCWDQHAGTNTRHAPQAWNLV
jgi:hypothetical protein